VCRTKNSYLVTVARHEPDIGGTTVYGVADSAEAVAADQLLPLGLAARATVVREVPVDQPLTYDDVELDDGSTILQAGRLETCFSGMARQLHARRSRVLGR
jgi:predicted homoserine dehydrogenase-like protein